MQLRKRLNRVDQIEKQRDKKRLTQSDAILNLGFTPGAYSKIESGQQQ